MNHNIVVVLYRPRDIRNIGAVVRAMKNMGFARLRLVEPVSFDPADITGIAHRSEDILATLEIFTDLGHALADTYYVVGTSSRPHAGRLPRSDMALFARELLAHANNGPLALLFGPEDNGLDLTALDRCHTLLALPCAPDYPSLNLAQSVLLTLYEVRRASLEVSPSPVSTPHSAAPAAELDRCLDVIGSALNALDFHKSGNGSTTERTLRALLMRAAPDTRELALLTAIAREVLKR